MKNSRGAYKMLVWMIRAASMAKGHLLQPPDFQNKKWSKRTLQYLCDAGYIQWVDQKEGFHLSDIGKINTLRELVKERKPDGKIRAVIFDIPEKFKRKRDVLRQHLIELGFTMEQKSVWSSPVPCEDLVRMVIKYHKLGKFTALIVGRVLQLDERSRVLV